MSMSNYGILLIGMFLGAALVGFIGFVVSCWSGRRKGCDRLEARKNRLRNSKHG